MTYKKEIRILTFDIEDWWVYNHYNIGKKEQYLPRLNRLLDDILELLDVTNTKATFFILGIVAKHYPEVVKRIASYGHHIGCHSYSHLFLSTATYLSIQEDTYRAISTIEDTIGFKVNTYRAPALSLMKENIWVIEILAQNGIQYDSSILPGRRSFGGYPDFPENEPCVITFNNLSIKEFPIPTTKIFGKQIAFSGGGYFRLFPYFSTKKIINNSNYVNCYFHIKDFDMLQKRKFSSLEGESAVLRYFKDYYGLINNFEKFKKLMKDFDFISIEQSDKIINWNSTPIVEI